MFKKADFPKLFSLSSNKDGSVSNFWIALPLVVFWVIWRMRNDCCFNNVQATWEDMVENVKVYFVQWFKFKFSRVPYLVNDFVYSFDLVRRCI